MALTTNRLTARGIAALKKPGIYADGAGLYLRVKSETARSWVFIYHIDGRRREAGLGPLAWVGLAQAREKAQRFRDAIAVGVDPVDQRSGRRDRPTFGEVADLYIEQREGTVRSTKSVDRWKRTIGPGG